MNLPIPPAVAALLPAEKRPQWSVMVPSYNCAAYIGETLASVLAQDPSAETMQICVVDDCSTDEVERVVASVGKGRVQFCRNAQNIGATRNFNACIGHSRGRLIHILHGDDAVEPGFYEQMSLAAAQHPSAGLIACRVFNTDARGNLIGLSERAAHLENCSRDVAPTFYRNFLETPGVVVSRSCYEELGGFLPELVHAADWEMWTRVIAASGGVFINRPLARYRDFSANHTSNLMRTGENLVDCLRLAAVFDKRYPGFDLRQFRRLAANRAFEQEVKFAALGDLTAAQANRRIWTANATLRQKAGRLARKLLRGSRQ